MHLPTFTHSLLLLSLTTGLSFASPTRDPGVPHLRIPGAQVAAKRNGGRLNARELPKAITLADKGASDLVLGQKGDKVLSNFFEAAQMDSDDWKEAICTVAVKGLDATKEGTTGTFDYDIQGAHKAGWSIDKTGHDLHMLVIFGVLSTDLSKYDLKDICKNALHVSAQDPNSLGYGAGNTAKTTFPIRNTHNITISDSACKTPIGYISVQLSGNHDPKNLFNAGTSHAGLPN